MPTYEYECPHCGHKFELFQTMTAKPLSKCPKCKKKPKRLIGSGAGIIFKGSGFYATDYRKSSPPQPSKSAPTKPNTCPKAKEGCNACSQG
ncbi:MAG: zinc ribbon domain-containing protein [Candidatus Omnitrophica bacterium]|nr:zinc ribbon domain-containing protein [Candidatus Omnitrophota bacterium]